MTEEQILELAFACGFRRETLMDKSMYDVDAWVSTPEELLKFAWEIYGIASDETLQDYESKF